MLIGEAAIYLFGLTWLSRFPLPVGVLDAGLLPFVAGDLYKLALAVVLLPPITRRVDGLGSRSGAWARRRTDV
jgi:biotin transporter BioY